MNKKKENFLYQINFNRKKYPEICQALEEAKGDNGIAFYLRELIMKDIEEKKMKDNFQPQSIAQPKPTDKTVEQLEPIKKPEPEIKYDNDLPDDSGGFI